MHPLVREDKLHVDFEHVAQQAKRCVFIWSNNTLRIKDDVSEYSQFAHDVGLDLVRIYAFGLGESGANLVFPVREEKNQDRAGVLLLVLATWAVRFEVFIAPDDLIMNNVGLGWGLVGAS